MDQGKSGIVVACAAAMALIVLCTTLMTVGGLLPIDRPWSLLRSNALGELVHALGPDRPFEPRLAGGFAWAPLRPTPADAQAPPVSLALLEASRDIERRAASASRRDAATTRALAASRLLTGRTAASIDLLKQALAGAPRSPAPLWSDLGAALLVRRQPGDAAAALDAAEKAIDLDPALPEAFFNLSLAADAAGLPARAVWAWRRYLTLDPNSPWSAEARYRLQSLEQVDVAASRPGDGSWRTKLEDEWLPSWARAVLANDADNASTLLEGSTKLARQIVEISGDRFALDAVDAASTAMDRKLVEAVALYGEARTQYLNDHGAEATALFTRAEPMLRAAKHPLALWAGIYLAIDDYQHARLDKALTALRAVRQAAAQRGYALVAAQCDWMTGLTMFTQGAHAGALDAYNAALQAFARAHDRESQAALQSLIATTYDQLGDRRQAWASREAALTGIARAGMPLRRHTVLRRAALAAVSDGLTSAALDFATAVVENAQRWRRPGTLAEAYLGRASALAAAGRAEPADADLQAARGYVEQVADANLRHRFQAEAIRIECDVLEHVAPEHAIDRLRRAAAEAPRVGADFEEPHIRLSLARALLRTGDSVGAGRELRAGIDVLERQLRGVTAPVLRMGAFDRAWDLYDELVALEVQSGRNDAALAAAERGRRQVLQPRHDPGEAGPDAGPITAVTATGAAEAVLYYHVGTPDSYCWILTNTGVEFVRLAVSSSALAVSASAYVSAVVTDDTNAAAQHARTLAALILHPVLDRLPARLTARPAGAPAPLLTIIPDGDLWRLPLGALPLPDGRPLLDAFAVTAVPSLDVALHTQQHANRTPLAPTSPVLVVDNPWPLSPYATDVWFLHEADQEAAAIRGVWRNVSILKGSDATSGAFLQQAGKAAVVHFAGHARMVADQPNLSRLLFASLSRDGNDSLTAQRIGALDLPQTRLVVLAACQTAAGRVFRGQGIWSLSSAFMAAGVPTVIATLWDVDDRAAHLMARRLHAELAAGTPVAEALRRAQIALWHESDPVLRSVRNWAPFVCAGAGR